MKGLFLDDERMPEDVTWVQYPKDVQWTIVRNYAEFVEEVSKQNFDIISFDHDLGMETHYKSGYECVKFLVELLLDDLLENIPSCFFHSQNPVGRKNMALYWKQAKKEYQCLNSQFIM